MRTEEKIKVLIVDDHTLVREAIAVMLKQEENIEVMGTVSSGEDAISESRKNRPNVVIMDIMLKGMTGIEATRWIKERDKQIRVILLSMEVRKEFVTAGIQSGIDGYLPKDVEQETLIEAINTVHKGEKFFNEAITTLVFEDFYNKQKVGPASNSYMVISDLTKREHEVLAEIATGKSNKEVADTLFISIKTVETHKGHILDKLGLKNTAELVRYAIKNKLISLE
jgi:DNA-binding NarL/FixJ family response regulator